jgi:hypothetical protein
MSFSYHPQPTMTNMEKNERLLRALAASSACRFGTTAPYELGAVCVRRIGFAEIPVVEVAVFCRSKDISALVAIVRQHAYGELESALIPSRILAFRPGVSIGRRRRFTDRNESSPSLGKTKVGEHVEFRFEIDLQHLAFFEWSSRTEGRIPEPA